MKVLHIVTAFQRDESDVITPWMVETLKRFRAKGIEVTVYTSSSRGLGDHEVGGIPVKRFRYFWRRWEVLSHDGSVPEQIKENKLMALLAVPYLFFGVLGLRRVLKAERFDVIHVHWPFPFGLLGYFAARWAQAPMVSQFYGVELRWVSRKMPIFIPLLRWVIKHSDLVVAISSHTKEEILRIAPAQVEIVPYGSPVPVPAEKKTTRGEPDRKRRVLFVGRLVERKGVEYLVRAFKELSVPFPVQLDVVGTGPEAQSLAKLVRELGLVDRVNLAGEVSSEELNSYYSCCDCFVLPAVVDSKGDTEGLGVVLIEALSNWKPVVASSVGGIVDIVHHEKTGLLVPEKDPRALAAAIKRILTDEDLAHRLAEQGHQFVRHYFDWDRIVDRWIELYREVLSRKEKG